MGLTEAAQERDRLPGDPDADEKPEETDTEDVSPDDVPREREDDPLVPGPPPTEDETPLP